MSFPVFWLFLSLFAFCAYWLLIFAATAVYGVVMLFVYIAKLIKKIVRHIKG